MSMLERNLTLPDVGATCIIANLHASKHLLNFMMRRIVNDYKQWLKFNVQESMAEERAKDLIQRLRNGRSMDLTQRLASRLMC